MGHQLVALALQTGVIEIRHLLTFKLLQTVQTLAHRIGQMVICGDLLLCADTASTQVFALKDMRDEGSVVAAETLLMDAGLV